MTRIRTTLAICGLAAALLSCSSGDDKKKEVSPTTAGGPTTVRPVDTSFTGQNSAEFCALAKTYRDRSNNVRPGSSPAELRAAAEDGRSAINDVLSAAPEEIKPDVEGVAAALGAVVTELEKVGFDTTKAPPAAFAPLQDPEFQTAAARFQAYVT
ncbi:MAG TPA: hypothetical protein VM287_02415, partial [Egibacteraceae bacterium]|nr:hypothetical protein [Egibacteraceae bacterium]